VKPKRIRVTVIWILGLAAVSTLAISWVGLLGLGGWEIYKAWGTREATNIAIGLGLILVFVGLAFYRLVNRFYDWWREQRLNALLEEIDASSNLDRHVQRFNSITEEYESNVQIEFPEGLKARMASSDEFRATVQQAGRLLAEYVVFTAASHTEQEREAFQQDWRSRLDRIAENAAKNDPLAVEIILRTIEKESSRAAGYNSSSP
jgi:hypothetical protein